MFENLVSLSNISYLLVFLEGLISFLSPCVIPLIPIYMSYLAGNAKQIDEEGTITYKKSTVFLHTVFFVMGISFAFFLLGMAFTALGSFFNKNQILFTRIGGIIITVLGLYQVGLFDFKVLKKERKIRLNINISKMNPLIAFLMGFTFSFAWTPCVGPALSSVLILASSAKSSMIANLLIILYSLGFVIPFLLIGLFTTQVLSFLKAKQKLLKYTVKIGGILLIIIGIMTFTGWMNGISKYLNKVSQPFGSSNSQTKDDSSSTGEESPDNNSPSNIDSQVPDNTEDIINKEDTNNDQADHEDKAPQEDVFPAIDFSLTDQYGNIHTLSDYKGKVVFLNFWATWCPPCVREMPDIEKIYKEYGENNEDVIILGVANPSSSAYPNNADESKEDIIAFLDDNNYSFPVVFDETGDLLREYYINAFPTTFLIDKNGNVYGYVPAMLTKDMMDNVIQETLDFTN
ncbi:MAG: redoxin domain-containing protein [Clostridiales bacterium]|jgi:cytochrome c-type biogenesis protein|nr:cytochrome c biogenesis protein CcdA [Bacillota bacterium]NLK04377.1 redoxin domain-containing protein [Clostridiales bacterium]